VKPTDAERDLAFDRLIARGLEGETDVSGRACPDADLLAAWFDRSLSASETERIESHAAACAMCQQILADLARSEPEIVRAAPVPRPARPWTWHWRWLVPAATVLVVAVAVGSRVSNDGEQVQMAARQVPSQMAEEAPPPSADAARPQVPRPSPAQPPARIDRIRHSATPGTPRPA